MPIAGKTVCTLLGALGTGGAALVYSIENRVSALTDVELHPPSYPWSHGGLMKSLDHQSIRRGYEVYKQVCSACHSLKFVKYREMIDVFMTEKEVKAECAEATIEDGPNEEGEMFMRPRNVLDCLPNPYPNKQAAMAANNGAEPPDLSYIVKGREGHENYIFSLLTNYSEPPAGVELPEGAHYNVYFKGGTINMAPPLYNEAIEYSDGTPATVSQMAKDVVTFLTWAGSPEQDYRKRLWIKVFAVLTFSAIGLSAVTKFKWQGIKTRKFEYVAPPTKGKRTKL